MWGLMCVCLVCGFYGVVVWGVGSDVCVCLVCGVHGVVVWGVGSDVCVFSVWCPWSGGVGCGV